MADAAAVRVDRKLAKVVEQVRGLLQEEGVQYRHRHRKAVSGALILALQHRQLCRRAPLSTPLSTPLTSPPPSSSTDPVVIHSFSMGGLHSVSGLLRAIAVRGYRLADVRLWACDSAPSGRDGRDWVEAVGGGQGGQGEGEERWSVGKWVEELTTPFSVEAAKSFTNFLTPVLGLPKHPLTPYVSLGAALIARPVLGYARLGITTLGVPRAVARADFSKEGVRALCGSVEVPKGDGKGEYETHVVLGRHVPRLFLYGPGDVLIDATFVSHFHTTILPTILSHPAYATPTGCINPLPGPTILHTRFGPESAHVQHALTFPAQYWGSVADALDGAALGREKRGVDVGARL
ncbi:hypothetical protein M427DRAFT_143636 [Gonapodya prolifera JEL478]|uniref:Uncharacterized protein n=1 Tax=Gonapodya prolifera (strain JEL478) TaxID=1344416 RepID=A0A139AR81_GONPJ|nr:hypothetical protein M427DRAFT_143636 [Gonapodya prolifera JEL478]|eukprot:KXS19033.1 hypothetical protein M427DRAFT_143636 [Gonapodya prolifera JEL478]